MHAHTLLLMAIIPGTIVAWKMYLYCFQGCDSTYVLICSSQNFYDVYPHLVAATDVPELVKTGDVVYDDVDAVFCCLPHATTQQIISGLPSHLKIVDLSADFRLRNVEVYKQW